MPHDTAQRLAQILLQYALDILSKFFTGINILDYYLGGSNYSLMLTCKFYYKSYGRHSLCLYHILVSVCTLSKSSLPQGLDSHNFLNLLLFVYEINVKAIQLLL